MKFGVVVFPGSTCERDAYNFITGVLKQECVYLWHEHSVPPGLDCILLPGGFSYGDYLRPGAMAAQAKIMNDVVKHARAGGLVIGICNGFQVLIESGLLPGALLRNRQLQFICKSVHIRVENSNTRFTRGFKTGDLLQMPVAHGDGNFYIPPEELNALYANEQVVFRYTDAGGAINGEANPNGSMDHIAGIVNRAGNVLGMMPHPERAGEALLGSTDGLELFNAILTWEGGTAR